MNDFRVAVIIPSKNRPQLVNRACSSVGNQLHVDLAQVQTIVVDDGSSPPLHGEDLRALAPNLTLLRNETSVGPAMARNLGAAASSATLLAFLDDDDVWLGDKLRSALSAFEVYPEAGVFAHRAGPAVPSGFGHEEWSAGLQIIHEAIPRVTHAQPPHPSTLVVRSDVHAKYPFDHRYEGAADLSYVVTLAAATPFVFSDRVHTVHSRPPTAGSEVGMQKRIEGRIRFADEHGFRFDKEAWSFHFTRLGYQYLRANLPGRATKTMMLAVSQRFSSGLAWRGLARAVASLARARLRKAGS